MFLSPTEHRRKNQAQRVASPIVEDIEDEGKGTAKEDRDV
jgi:hypothetical protein